MLDIRAHVRRNRLYVTFRPSLTLEEVEEALRIAPREIEKLLAPFDILTDVAGVDTLAPDLIGRVTELGVLLHHRGGKRIVRVVGRHSGLAVQLERMSRNAGQEAYLAFSLEEAERLLDGF